MDASVATASSISVSLEESDVDGAQLEEPLEAKTMVAMVAVVPWTGCP